MEHFCLFYIHIIGCLYHELLLARGDEEAVVHRDDTELDDTELTGVSG